MCKFLNLKNAVIKQNLFSSYTTPNIVQKMHKNLSVYTFARNDNNVILRKVQITRICGLQTDRGDVTLSKFDYNLKLVDGQRMIHTTNVNRRKQQRSTPNIIYYQSPVSWLKNKYYVKKLQRTWDPEFNQAEFIRGSKQVQCIITFFHVKQC